MNNYIPVFEIKDSYIIKHKLDYNTSYTYGKYDSSGNFISYIQRMIFTDYELARKSQSINAENFNSIELSYDLTHIGKIDISYLDDVFTIYLDRDIDNSNLEYENNWIKNSTIFNTYKPKEQKFSINSFNNDILVDDIVTVEIYQKIIETDTISWEYESTYIGETFFITGTSPNGMQWIITKTSTKTGYQSGTENWSVENITPLLKYDAKVINRTNDSVSLESKIENAYFNDYSSLSDVYFKIISNNHCAKTYSNILNKLRYYKYYDYFTYEIINSSLKITPIKNTEDIYFYYDKVVFSLSYSGDFYVDVNYVLDNFVFDTNSYNYYFNTNNIYNKYSLEKLLTQTVYTGTDDIYYSGITYVTSMTVENNYYMKLIVNDITPFTKYTYIKGTSNGGVDYNMVITNITSAIVNNTIINTITVIKPFNHMENEIIVEISNITTIAEISNILEKTFENLNINNYRKLPIEIRRKIYNAYGDIINKLEINQPLRVIYTGLLYENQNNKMVLKIFDPTDFKDKRLTYIPIEMDFIGKDKKTTIPLVISDYTLGLTADLISPQKNTKDIVVGEEPNTYIIQTGPIYVFNSNLDDIELVIDANLA